MAKIKVALRVRPLSEREFAGKYPLVVGINEKCAFITDIRVPERPKADSRQRLRQFNFDHGFWLTENGSEGAAQEEVYQEIGPPLEKSILAGYNACLLAYGQSGTGKTHTMLGTKKDPGLIPRLCQGLWDKLKSQDREKSNFRMEVSFIEIYREKVRDLLTTTNKSLKLREHPQLGPHVQGLTRVEVSEQLGLLDLLWEGESRRASGTTGSNRRSSRSHAIWTLYLSSTRHDSGLITANQVHLVDLAGSEKADLITAKNLLAEGKDINRSLVSLGNVISALAEKAQYIPYRDSALTWLLKDSLGGNAATSIIITASPASCCHAQTLNSLRFAQRARLVENQPKVNFASGTSAPGMFPSMSMFDLRKDLARLATIIRSAQSNGGILRGLMPRTGWNRLISAIENWNHQSSEQQKRQSPMRAGSVETPTTSTSTTKSLSSDAMVQADIEREECYVSASQSVNTSPSKIPGTEVFIPYSNSIKCLTWRQQEVRLLPKTAASSDSEDETFVSPPTSPPLKMKINHLKYLLPVKYPTSHTLDSESRIGERIHGNLQSEKFNFSRITPTEVLGPKNCPVVRERRPTLVNPQEIPNVLNESASENQCCASTNTVPVRCRSVETSIPKYGFGIPEVSEFSKPAPVFTTPFESTDEDEETFECSPKENKCFTRFRLRRKVEDAPVTSSVEEALFFSESSLTSSSSCESIEIIKGKYLPGNESRPVKVVRDRVFDFSELEGKHFELENEPKVVEHYVATTVSCSELDRHNETTLGIDNETDDRSPCDLFDGVSSSKFRNHFVKEFHQMENIGAKIKKLREMTRRCQIVKPYLDKIARLDWKDHTLSDPILDAEIEACSGWNVDVEFQRVQDQLISVNRLLKYGVNKPASMEINSPLSTRESVISSTSSDSYKYSTNQESSRKTSNASTFSQPISENISGGKYYVGVGSRATDECFSLKNCSPKCSRSYPVLTPQTYEEFIPSHHSSSSNTNTGTNYTPKRRKHILPKTHQYLHHGRVQNSAMNQISTGATLQQDQVVNSHFIQGISTRHASRSEQPLSAARSLSVENGSCCERGACHECRYNQGESKAINSSSYQNSRRLCSGHKEFADTGPSNHFLHIHHNSTNTSSSHILKKLCNVRKHLFDM